MRNIFEPVMSSPMPKAAHPMVAGAENCIYIFPEPDDFVTSGIETARSMPVFGENETASERAPDTVVHFISKCIAEC